MAVHWNKFFGELAEGDIVKIIIVYSEYLIEVLEDETSFMKDQVSNLQK